MLDWLTDPPAVVAACNGLEAAGPKAAGPTAVPWLIDRAERSPAVREPAGHALAKFGGDQAAAALAKRTKWTDTREADAAEPDVRRWVYTVLARLDPRRLSAAERERLGRVLFAAKSSDPAAANRPAAETAWERLRPGR